MIARLCCVCVSLVSSLMLLLEVLLGAGPMKHTLRVMGSLWLIHGDNESDGRAGTVAVVNLRNKKLEFMAECVACTMRGGIEAGVRSFFLICGGESEMGLLS